MDNTQRRFSYADYEEAIRAPEYDAVRAAGRAAAAKFSGCRRVLDVASGQGFLLDALQNARIEAVGVDNEPDLVAACRQRGLTVFGEDALQFLKTTKERFDGVNCAHFIEHLPFEAVVDLVEGIQRVLLSQGRLVLRWPNPRSLEMQHISFWKDPTHVRFYDGQLVEAVLTFYGFSIDSAHHDRAFARIQPNLPGAVSGNQTAAAPRVLRQTMGGRVRGLLNGPLGFTGLHKILAVRDRVVHPQKVLQQLVKVPLEAEIIALRGSDPEISQT